MPPEGQELRPVRLLLVEDSEDDAALLKFELVRQGFAPEITRVDSGPALRATLSNADWDLVVSDHNLPGFGSLEAVRIVKELSPDLPFIIVSGSIGEEYAVEAMRSGASDFVVKTRLHRLAPAVERELREAEQRKEQRRTAAALAESEERLRQAQKLEAIGRLAGGVAHDFNNLLTAILGYTDLALSSITPGDPNRADLEEVKLAGTRAVDLTRQLLAFSRQQVLHAGVLDLGQVVGEITRLLGRVIGEDIHLETSHADDLWHVLADRAQIEQIVMNLAVNARDAMSGGGTLRIETSNVSVGETSHPGQPPRPGDYVRLVVADTGEGIAADVLPRIFEPFFTTKEAGRGTGLGLATVYGIVKQSDGFIFVDSERGRGSAFSVYLPRTTEVAPAEALQTSAVLRGANEAILLVEDEHSVRELAMRVLRNAGFEVFAAENPHAALRIFSTHGARFDLLLTDVVMPDMSGPALAGLLTEKQPDLNVLFMSGFSGDSVGSFEKYGQAALLPKPFTPDGLIRRVREVLSR